MMFETPVFVAIGASDQMLPDMRHEACDECLWKQVWLTPKMWLQLEKWMDRDKRCICVCVGCGIRKYGRSTVVQILVSQQED